MVMIMAAAVDPFSIATAELSEDYVKTFQNPDIVPKYLEEVRDKAGVVVFAVGNCINIKGSWISLERARLFLTELYASYHVTEAEDEKKDIDLFESDNETENPPFSEEADNNNEGDDDQKPVDVSGFQDGTDEPSDWIRWTKEVLPQIQPVRSKRCNESSERKAEANKIPEPLVLYANYQPTPDPTAKVTPTLDAIEKVLKTVYHESNKLKITFSEPAPNTTVSDYSTKIENEGVTELDHQSTTVVTRQSLADHNLLGGEHKLNQTNTGFSSADEENQQTLPPEADVTASSLSRDKVTGTETSLHHAPQDHDILGSTNAAQSHSVLAKEQNEVHRKQSTKRKSSRMNNDFVCKFQQSGDAVSSTEYKRKEHLRDPLTSATNDSEHDDFKNQTVSKLKETRRKSRPRKKPYQSKTPACEKQFQSDVEIQAVSSKTERTSKRKSPKPMKAVFPELDPVNTVKRKTGRQQYSQEVKKVHVEGKGYLCELCPYVAKKLKHLHEHKRRVHNHEGKQFKCEECGKVFGFGKDLKRHRLSHQRAENCCDICGKMYKGVRNLAEHKKTHETNYIKPEFPCEFCQKIFSTKYVLAYHVKSEHLGMKKTYLCPTCGKSFSQKNSYLQHANVHMGIKPFQCDICGRSFSYDKSLREHKFMHQDDKHFECDVCHKRFRQSSGVAIHMRIHQERKDYVCSSCGKGFSQKQALIRHERIHAGDKPFTCNLCQRSFTDSSVLRRHMILIHKKDRDKWQEDTENKTQRRTDFFISVVTNDKLSQESQINQEGTRIDEMNSCDEQIPEQAQDNSVTEPAKSGDDNGSCPTEDAGFSFVPVGIGSVTSMPQPSSLSETVLTIVPSVSLPHQPEFSGDAYAASNTGITLSDAAHNPLPVVQPAVDKLESDAVFGVSAEPSSSTFSQTVLVSSQSKVSLQEQTSGILNPLYTCSEPSTTLPSAVCSDELQQNESSVTNNVQYPEMVAQGGEDYHTKLVLMSDALATLHYHTEAVNVASSSQEQTADCEDLVTDSSVLQQ